MPTDSVIFQMFLPIAFRNKEKATSIKTEAVVTADRLCARKAQLADDGSAGVSASH